MGIAGLENKMASMDATAAPEAPKTPERIQEGAPPKAPEPQEPGGETPAGKIPGQGGDGIPEGGSDVADVLKNAAEKAEEEYEFNVDGQTIKKKYSYEQRKALMQKAQAADKRLNDFNRLQQREAQIVWLAQNRTDLLMQQLGVDPDQWAHDRILKKIERENMSPEQRQSLENTERLRMSEEENKKLKHEKEQGQLQARADVAKENYTKEINAALGDARLPSNMWTQKRVVHYLQEAYQKMGVKLPAKEVITLVKEDYINEQRALLTNMDPEGIVETLGDDVRRKLREHELSLVQKKTLERQGKGQGYKPRAAQPQPNAQPKTMEDFRRHNAELRGERY